jgi:SAM-dependent methyltransferase
MQQEDTRMAGEMIETAARDELGQRLGRDFAGALTVGLIYLGDRLGLLAALRDAGPTAVEGLAARTGLVERYVEEWLAGMAAAGWLAYEPAERRFTLTPEQATYLADPESLSYAAPLATCVLINLAQADRIATAFRQGGGVPFDAYGPPFAEAMERLNRPKFHSELVPHWLPMMPGVVDRLTTGGSFLDVGCGGGLACIEVARAFPRASVLGLDRHAPSIARARAHARDAGVKDRVRFETMAVGELPAGTRFDVVTTFDVVHDLADPVGVLRAIRAVLAPGGGYLMNEAKVGDCLEENIGPQGALDYGISVFHCLPQSLAEGGAGLGACMGQAKARELAAEAGFGSFTVLPIDEAYGSFYDLRP